MLLAKASASKQENPSLYTVETARVESTFDLSILEAVDFLDTFLSMNPDSSGQVKIHNFFRVLRLKACNLSEKSLRSYLGEEKLKGFINFALHYVADLDIAIKSGTFIAFRSGMLNVSPIGQNCSQEERDEFEKYDKVLNI